MRRTGGGARKPPKSNWARAISPKCPGANFPTISAVRCSKPLVMPQTAGARHIDYRISMYQPMARVARHQHRVQEQIYHVLEGEG